MKLAASAASVAACSYRAHHPLVRAVGHVLGRFQMGIGAQPLAGTIEFAVERQALGECGGPVAERAAELFVLRDLLLPRRERLLPLVVVLTQAGKVPRVGGLYLAARGSFLVFAMREVWQPRSRYQRNQRCAPRKAAAETAHEEQIVAAETAGAERLVEGNRHAAGRRVAVAIDVRFDFRAVDRQRVGCRVENANVGLVENPQLDVRRLETRRLEHLLRGIFQQPHGPLEHGAAVHLHEPIGANCCLAVERHT